MTCFGLSRRGLRLKRRRTHTACFCLACCLGLLIGAGCASESGREADSVTEAQRRALDPRAASFMNDAQRAYRQGAYHIALALADSAAQYAPDLADAPFIRGLIYSKLNRFDASQAAYEKALALDSAYRSAWFNLGHNAFLQGRYREALGFYRNEEAAIEATPKADKQASPSQYRAVLSAVLLQIGRAYVKLGVADSARAFYEHALAADSSNAQAFSWMSELNGQAGDLDQALAHARRAYQLDPNNPEYRYGVGAFLVRTGQIEEALGHLEAVLAQQPWHVGAHYNLGRALMTLGRRDEAQRYLEKTDSLQQRNADIALAQLATFQYPNDPTRWRQLAGLLLNAVRLGEARQAYDVARSLRGQ